ncbi:hypothetical protein BCV72DRAFT_310929 [Rhizopus microsporus var. microsporus]|uniref:Uncharacterized protein n=2 Tax=Rhizopus microsporus TaxID=58291 RepID=A0A2G4SZU0_RHIZD|nr:uncharacterized protein RHIMIDRAFT_250394 [Rhizopus microsporus ATCC 52813]ORE12043.1 hypothetical protein BCV72DRAFT_310929 [Rhizopus microsporus var. microsporus]PHZ14264.1 hypothetical protein RHIMIDRAFT_250394 [Rhizopus microsporus ATCC 52813]
MKRKKDDDPPPPKAKRNKGKDIRWLRVPFLVCTNANKFIKNTAFEASNDDFQETPLLRKDKSICTTLKAIKDGTSSPDPSNVVINEKTSMPTVNKDASVQVVLPAPIPSTSCTSAPIKTSKKYQDKVGKTEALKKEKEKNKTTSNEQVQVQCPSCGETDHPRSSSKPYPMNISKTKLPKPKDTVERTSIIKTYLANTCRYPKFLTLWHNVE